MKVIERRETPRSMIASERSVSSRPAIQRRQRAGDRLLRYWRNNWTLLLLALPGVTLIFALRYIPMFGIVVAFQDHKAASGFFSPWVGFQNFRLLVESPVLGRLVWNTLYLNTLFI